MLMKSSLALYLIEGQFMLCLCLEDCKESIMLKKKLCFMDRVPEDSVGIGNKQDRNTRSFG